MIPAFWLWWCASLPSVPSAPTVADLGPEIGGRYAVGVIAALTDERAAGRLICYRRHDGEWMVHLPATVVPGGDTVSLKVWAVKWYPGLRLEYLDRERLAEDAGSREQQLTTPSTEPDASSNNTIPPAGCEIIERTKLATRSEHDALPSLTDFCDLAPLTLAYNARTLFLDELAADCLWPYRVHGEWQVWVADGRRMSLNAWIWEEFLTRPSDSPEVSQ